MAFQGGYFVERYGSKAAERTPPIRLMPEAGVPVGAPIADLRSFWDALGCACWAV